MNYEVSASDPHGSVGLKIHNAKSDTIFATCRKCPSPKWRLDLLSGWFNVKVVRDELHGVLRCSGRRLGCVESTARAGSSLDIFW